MDGNGVAVSSAGSELPAPKLPATSRDGDIDIDGRLDEPAWLLARPTTRFVQGEPIEGASPESQTEVRVLFDEAAIYVAVMMYEDNPADIGDQLVRRDENGQNWSAPSHSTSTCSRRERPWQATTRSAVLEAGPAPQTAPATLISKATALQRRRSRIGTSASAHCG